MTQMPVFYLFIQKLNFPLASRKITLHISFVKFIIIEGK